MKKSIFDKEVITQKDIEDLVKNQIEESINLDYKRGESLKKSESSKKELSKDVSAFANSAGGLIIYGVGETNHVPDGYYFLDGDLITKEWIEQILQTRIQRKIPNLRIIPIRFNQDVKQTIYVVKIPESIEAPHQASDNRFYKRYNFESVKMEEYEVRSLYNKYQTTTFEISNLIINKSQSTKPKDGNLSLWIHVKNTGRLHEDKYKLTVKCPKSIFVDSTSRALLIDNKKLNYSVKYKGETMTINKGANETIFPNEKYQFGYVEIKVDSLEMLKGKLLSVELIHKGGKVKRDFELEKLIKQSHLE